MKLSAVMLFVTALSTQAADSFSQKVPVSIEVEDASVKYVLDQIEFQSDYKFFYSGDVDLEREVSLSAENEALSEVLEKLFEETTIDFNVAGKQIALYSKADPVEAALLQDEIELSGKVVDSETGEALYGATIIIKGSTVGTVSGADGIYTLKVSPDDVLMVSYIGYISQEISVNGRSAIDIQLEMDVARLEEVVAIGYGTVRKVDLTGSVATVDSEDLVKVSTTNTAQAIQGRMSGVQVTASSGEPGANSTIKIRGIGSLKSNNSPLVIIDGFAGDISDVNPYDIASVSVLKDASAASIYGARAANGVIVITTKRGAEGKIQVDFTAEHGITSLTKKPQFLNARDFAIKQNEVNTRRGRKLVWVDENDPDSLGEGTDWWDFVYGQGKLDKYHLGVRGGNEATKYSLSIGYFNEEGMIPNTSFNQVQTRFNFDHKFNKWLSIGANYDVSRAKRFNGNENIWGDGIKYSGYGLGIAAYRTSPTVPAYFEDGSKGIYVREKPGEKPGNGTLPPHWYLGNKVRHQTNIKNRVTTFAEITFLEGLKYKAVFNAYQGSMYSTHFHKTWIAYYPDSDDIAQVNETNALNTNSDDAFSWEVQQLLTFDRSFGDHHISALAGFSAEQSTRQWVNLTSEGFLGNELHVADAAAETVFSGGSKSITAYVSQFGRVQYDYAGKYLVQGTVRRDGSSAFAPGHQYGIFPSISGAWRISHEAFMDNVDFLSNLKIRGGYGELGNARIPSYRWLSTFKLTDGYAFGGGNPQVFQPAYYTTEIANREVKWETTATLDIGLDIGMLNNQLSFEFDYYDKMTRDLLWPATVPETAGAIDGPMVNIGKVSNKGWEITISWDDNIGAFNYGFSANLSRNSNMVVDMGDIPEQLEGNIMVKEGYPINSFWGYKVDGIWRTWEELENNVHRTGDIRPGDWRFANLSGADEDGNNTGIPDTVINSYDMTYLGDAIPDFYYGFSGYMEYKGIDFSFLINGEEGKQSMIGTFYGGGYDKGGNVIQYYFDNRAILNEDGEVISGTRNASGADAGNGSEATLHDVSYMRIKNLQLGYTLPASLTSRLKIASVRIYLNATNPFLFTDYVGWDQESADLTSGTVSLGGNQYVPVTKVLSGGVSVKF